MSEDGGREQLHDQLRALLPAAHAESCKIVATFLDIRGFSAFAERTESFDTALYLRTIFSAILADFEDAAFFKPTGDGLLLVHELPADTDAMTALVNSVLRRCADLAENFAHITADDVNMHFEVPAQLGVGVARGSATRLVSGSLVLDYTGRCLNLAARLMDKARPSGVVFHDRLAAKLLDQSVSPRFTSDEVFIKGIAEADPLEIFTTKGVEITRADREPISDVDTVWGDPVELSVEKVRGLAGYRFYLPRKPRSYEFASVWVDYPTFGPNGKEDGSHGSLSLRAASLEADPDGWTVAIQMGPVKQRIIGLPSSTKFLGINQKTMVTFTPGLERKPVRQRKRV